MKLRISGNSIRLRLSVSEVEIFEKTGSVSDRIEFGPDLSSQMTYELCAGEPGDAVTASIEGQTVSVKIPPDIAHNWTNTDSVGFNSQQNLDGKGVLNILIEKDFVCLKEREGEDESDRYPHPNAELSC